MRSHGAVNYESANMIRSTSAKDEKTPDGYFAADIDTGCSATVTNDRKAFIGKLQPSTKVFRLVDNTVVRVTGEGLIPLFGPALYVPEFRNTGTLVSMREFAEYGGVYALVDEAGLHIMDYSHNEIALATFNKKAQQYRMAVKYPEAANSEEKSANWAT